MGQFWFYKHLGETRGPLSSAEIKELASVGKLDAQDPLWHEGTDPESALPADAAIDFPSLPPSAPLPEWLAAVEEPKGPVSTPVPTTEIPEWLEEMRLWFGLGTEVEPIPPPCAVEAVASPAPATRRAAATVVELPAVAAQATPPSIRLAPPAETQTVPAPILPPLQRVPVVAAPPAALTPAVRIEIPLPVAPASPPQVIPAARVQAVGLAPAARTRIGPPVAPEAVPIARPPTVLAPAVLIQQTLAETGFDLETGRVLDPVKLQRWRQQSNKPASAEGPAARNASLLEAFRKARRAIESWVDDDNNRHLVANAALDKIHGNPAVQEILYGYAAQGSEMEGKLKRHLAFMVDNRRKYYQALANA